MPAPDTRFGGSGLQPGIVNSMLDAADAAYASREEGSRSLPERTPGVRGVRQSHNPISRHKLLWRAMVGRSIMLGMGKSSYDARDG